MALTAREPSKLRVTADKVVLTNLPFCRWLSKRSGVSSQALNAALTIITNGVREGMADGYAIRLLGLGVFEMRELAERRRYHRQKKIIYVSPPSVVAHFRKSDSLTTNVRALAKARLSKAHTTPTVKRAGAVVSK